MIQGRRHSVLRHGWAGENNGASLPPVEFRMPIAERHTATAIVSAGGKVDEFLILKVSASGQPGIVNTINAFVRYQENLRRTRPTEVTGLAECCVGAGRAIVFLIVASQPRPIGGQSWATSVGATRIVSRIDRADRLAHGNTPGGRDLLPLISRIGIIAQPIVKPNTAVGGAVKEADVIGNVRGQHASARVPKHIGVEFVRPPDAHSPIAPAEAKPSGSVVWIGREKIIEIECISIDGQRHLLGIIQALGLLGFSLGLGKGRQKHGRQNGDDGDNDQELDESETSFGPEARDGFGCRWQLRFNFHSRHVTFLDFHAPVQPGIFLILPKATPVRKPRKGKSAGPFQGLGTAGNGWECQGESSAERGEREGGFGGLEPLHRNNLHFTEEFFALSRYKAVTRGLHGVTPARNGTQPCSDSVHRVGKL
jgi:hypothetical protein